MANGIYYNSTAGTLSFFVNNQPSIEINSGGTTVISGTTIFDGTISATTIVSPSLDVTITGGTYSQSSGSISLTNSTGGTVPVSGYFNYITGGTYSSGTITLRTNTGQTTTFSNIVNGNGTTNYIPKWTGSTGISNSTAFDDGSFFTIPNTYISNSFKFINAIYDGRVNPYNNLVLIESSNLVKPLSNEGFGGSENLNSGDSFLTLSNDSDSRAIEIFYNLRSTNDDNFRSGKIIANWDGTYTNFYQTEYGPSYDLNTMTFIDPPRVIYGGSGTLIRITVAFDDVTDPSNLLTARFKYVLI